MSEKRKKYDREFREGLSGSLRRPEADRADRSGSGGEREHAG